MNRILIALLVVLLVATGTWLLTVDHRHADYLIDFFPEDTLAVVEIDNPFHTVETWLPWVSSSVLHHPDLFALAARAGVPVGLLADIRTAGPLCEKLVAFLSSQSFFGGKAVVGLLPTTVQITDTSSMLRGVVLALNVSSDFSPEKLLQDVFGPILSRNHGEYQGEILMTYTLQSGYSLTFWLQGNTLVCAQDSVLLQRCIDQSLRRLVRSQNSLRFNTHYQRLRLFEPTPPVFFIYADIARLRSLLRDLDYFESWLGGLVPTHLAASHASIDENHCLKLVALVNPASLQAAATLFHLNAPAPLPGPIFAAPENVISLWTNLGNLNRLWSFAMENATSELSALLSTAAQQFSELTGGSLYAFFDAFADGFGVFIQEDVTRPQPLRSTGCLVLEVRDRTEVAAIMQRLVTGLQVVAVKSGELEISSVLLAGGLLQPAFAQIDNQLLLADSVSLIEQAVQRVRSGSGGLGQDQGESDDRNANLFFFARSGQLIDRLLPLLFIAAKENSDRHRVLSPEQRALVREIWLPLLAQLQGLATTRLRSSVSTDTVQLEFVYTFRRR